jgi:hypothetical protein
MGALSELAPAKAVSGVGCPRDEMDDAVGSGLVYAPPAISLLRPSRTLLGNEPTADFGSIEPRRNVRYPTAACTPAELSERSLTCSRDRGLAR